MKRKDSDHTYEEKGQYSRHSSTHLVDAAKPDWKCYF